MFDRVFSYFSQDRITEGIVTLADEHYFLGLLTLCYSVQKSYAVPIICFDIGLTKEQIAWIGKNLPYLEIKKIPDLPIINKIKLAEDEGVLLKQGKRQWPLWICPFLINETPFQRIFWLDCDLVVLRDLKTLFGILNNGPVFTPENHAPELTANKPELYDLLPIDHKFSSSDVLINAGVSGWDKKRDRSILDYYMEVVYLAFSDNKIKQAISWHDQGALIWAVLKSNSGKYVLKDNTWNCCAKHTQAYQKQYVWNETVIDLLREDIPEVNIVHWNGCVVPWSRKN